MEVDLTDDSDDNDGEKKDSGVLVKEEEREEGVVKFSVYRMYWKSIGMVLAPLILISLLLMQGGWVGGYIHIFCLHCSHTSKSL